jgi:hypothetical protein
VKRIVNDRHPFRSSSKNKLSFGHASVEELQADQKNNPIGVLTTKLNLKNYPLLRSKFGRLTVQSMGVHSIADFFW